MKNLVDGIVFVLIIVFIGTGLYLYYQEYLPAIDRYQGLLKENRILSEIIEEMKEKEISRNKEKAEQKDFQDRERIKKILKTESFNFTDEEEGIHISFSTNELFGKNSTDFTNTGKKMMKKLGIIVNGVDNAQITIESYAGKKRFGGKLKEKFPSSWEFASLRASAVARYLQDSAGIDPSSIKIVSYGSLKTDNKNGKKETVEIIIKPSSPEDTISDTND